MSVVFHFSEDPTISRFEPHVALTAADNTPLVWAIDDENAPLYWFPRECPRAIAWRGPSTRPADAERILGPGGGDRVHAIEYRWLPTVMQTVLYAYRLPADTFRSLGHSALVSEAAVSPLEPPSPVGDLLELHARAGIQIRVLPSLWPFWDAVVTSTLLYSGIRLHNAEPRR